MNKRFIEMVERIGYINKNDEHIKGTAALLHITHMPVSEFDPKYIEIGKKYVHKILGI